MKSLFLISFVFVLLGCHLAFGQYHGEKVIRLALHSEKERQILQNILPEDVDIWSFDSNLVIGQNDIRVSPDLLETINSTYPFEYDIWIEDVQKHVEAQEIRSPAAAADWNAAYHTYAEMIARLKEFASTYPTLVTYVSSIGKSNENRDIPALIIGAPDSAKPKRIWWNAGQHAREWIAPATLFYIIEQLLIEATAGNAISKELVSKLQFVIVPMVNPDGYEWTKSSRLWRKNRRLNSNGSYGVDLNRNWDVKWGQGGSSSTPSSDTYMGTAPFSEPETKAVSNYLLSKDVSTFYAGIDFHSYSQLILRPYGWSSSNSPDETKLKAAGATMAAIIKANGGKTYDNIKSIELYITTGTASDYYYSKGIVGAWTLELRDTGTYGFELPASQIIPTGVEIWAAVKDYTYSFIKTTI